MGKHLSIEGDCNKSVVTKSDRSNISFYWSFKAIPAEKSPGGIEYTALLYFFADFSVQ